MNGFRTAALLGGMTALFAGVGWLIGGGTGMVLALALAVATNAFAWWNSDRLALSMHGAKPASRSSFPQLNDTVARLARQAGVPVPKVYVIAARQPNAFATGRNPDNAAVAATTGLLHYLSPAEVEGVMAHEIAHIKNRDTLLMTVAATLAGAITMLANIGFFFGGSRERGSFGVIGVLVAVVLAPLAAALIQMAISRTREFAADRGAAEITGAPLALASALQRIEGEARRIYIPSAETHPATAHMFIVNPLTGLRLDRLFSTHPPTDRRIAALRALASGRPDEPAAAAGPRRRKSPFPVVRRR